MSMDKTLIFALRWTLRFAKLLASGLSRPVELPPYQPPPVDPADMPQDDQDELYGCTSWRRSRKEQQS